MPRPLFLCPPLPSLLFSVYVVVKYVSVVHIVYYIVTAQPIGQPEISRMSVSEMCVNQTSDLFVIGKNFLKGTQILFQEIGADETDIKWQSEAEIEVEYFQQASIRLHLVLIEVRISVWCCCLANDLII